jgi:hypothetical protein
MLKCDVRDLPYTQVHVVFGDAIQSKAVCLCSLSVPLVVVQCTASLFHDKKNRGGECWVLSHKSSSAVWFTYLISLNWITPSIDSVK